MRPYRCTLAATIKVMPLTPVSTINQHREHRVSSQGRVGLTRQHRGDDQGQFNHYHGPCQHQGSQRFPEALRQLVGMVRHPPRHQKHQKTEQGKARQHGQGGLKQQPVEQVVGREDDQG